MLCRRDALAGIREKINLCDGWLNCGAGGGNFFAVVTGAVKFIVKTNSDEKYKYLNYMLYLLSI
jgi:hypothetical protein